MNWLTNYVKPKLQAFRKKDTPDNLWHKCRSCEQLIFTKEFKAAMSVCANCGHHERIGPTERFEQLFDEAMYEVIGLPEIKEDPLNSKIIRNIRIA